MLSIIKKLLGSDKTTAETKASIKLVDIDSKPLTNGDKVNSLRYGLEECILHVTDTEIYYESVNSGERVSYTKMVDATTECQKVRKI